MYSNPESRSKEKRISLIRPLALIILVWSLTTNNASAFQLAVANVNIVDVESGEVLNDQTVVIEEGRIAEIRTSDTVATLDQGITVVDGRGKYMIPGLWDMHVHLPMFAAKLTMPLFIANGVTGVREMGGFVSYTQKKDWQDEINAGTLLGPRLMGVAHTVVTSLNSVDEAAERASRGPVGVDHIKIYHQVQLVHYLRLLEEAKKAGVTIVGHRPQSVSAMDASIADQKSLEHARLFLYESFPGAEELRARFHARYSGEDTSRDRIITTALRREMIDTHDPELFNEIAAVMVEFDTWFCPTHLTRKMDAFADNEEYRNDPRLKYIPSIQRRSWIEDADGMISQDPSEDGRQTFMDFYLKGLELTGKAHQAGVKILAGTDANDTYVFPGFSLHDELQELVKAGLTPIDALRAATLLPAEYFEVTQEYGSIAKGKVADMVLIDANPLVDISNTTKINTVIFGGKVHTREELDEMLDGVERLIF